MKETKNTKEELTKSTKEVTVPTPDELLIKLAKGEDVELDDSLKEQLKEQLKNIQKKVRVNKRGQTKYKLPEKPRTGKYAKVLENRDKRVIWENELYKLNKDLFVRYLELQKKNMTLEKWEEIYKLS